MPKPIKLSKAQVKEALKTLPIERVLFGSIESGAPALTAKQKAFAAEIAAGETKAGAYRKAYKSKAKPKTAHSEAAKLLANPRVSAEVETKKAENAAQESQTPAELRAWTIKQLEQHAQNESFPPAQRVKCLELLGKITEVALFTERREVVQTVASHELRDKLLAHIRAAMKSDAIEVEAKEAGALMGEIKAAKAGDAETIDAEPGDAEPIPASADPLPADPLNPERDTATTLHSIPHIQSAEAHLPELQGEPDSSVPVTSTITPVIVQKPL